MTRPSGCVAAIATTGGDWPWSSGSKAARIKDRVTLIQLVSLGSSALRCSMAVRHTMFLIFLRVVALYS